jgi:hypothetical protein
MFTCQTILACAGLARYGPAPISWWAYAYRTCHGPIRPPSAAGDFAHPEPVLSAGPLVPFGVAAPLRSRLAGKP